MDEEDDDLYGPSETAAPNKDVKDESDGEQGDEPMDEGMESGDDEDESDSDVDIIIDKPATAPKQAAPQPQESKAIKIEAPPQQSTSTPSGKAPTTAQGPTVPSQPGTAYPAVRTSTIDVNADPIYPPAGKPISKVDMDADLADATKPWRLPGSDQSDYFNYGFDEFTWEMYRQRQAGMAANLNAQKAETAQFQQMFMPGMSAPGPNPAAGAGGVPNAPSGPSGGGGGMRGGAGDAGMGGMPDLNEEQMMQMMSQMQASGMNPQNMDFNTFMQMAGGMGMGGPGPGFGNQPQGNHGGGGGARGGGGRRGRGGW